MISTAAHETAKSFIIYNVRKYFFTHRVVDTWNKMSEDTVISKTVNRFKNQIDSWFKQHGGLYISII